MVLTVVTPIAAWWLVGPLDESIENLRYDYLIRAPDVDPTVERLAGVSSVVGACLALILVAMEFRRGRIDRGWLAVTACIAISGFVVGAAARVVTAGVGGANIGGALLLYGLPPVLLTVWATTAVLFLRSRPRRRLGS